MNIGDGQTLGGLFERIESAYQESKLNEVPGELAATAELGQAEGLSAATAAGSEATSSFAPPSAESWAHLESPVQRGLLQLCSDAMKGRFKTEDELRNGVVQTIVEHRYSGPLVGGQAEQIMQTLSATLTADPNFREEVEHLLVLAARELA